MVGERVLERIVVQSEVVPVPPILKEWMKGDYYSRFTEFATCDADAPVPLVLETPKWPRKRAKWYVLPMI